ncbi:AsmA-like C-terminal domain-containing protein [Stappia sp. F7233]|uniref:AsmA-like C-terminal domain-containing protein n=1 Tax=Stappia albiluteola TaxID=2758565 RepID=A0A839AA91_9HYPH|nr:AsmA-like C-terminal domain-containing protein [Stappia albiluteola]MBA5776483.1 AsmA-like C-terminal domain-containing protein [Stappia albiluteola]
MLRKEEKGGERRQTSRRRRIVLVLAALLAVLTGLLVVRIAHGPISLPRLASFLEERAASRGYHLAVGDVMIDLSSGKALEVVLDDVVIDTKGKSEALVAVPRISAPVDISEAIGGRITFHSLIFDRPSLALKAGEPDEATPDMSVIMEAADRLAEMVLSEFERRDLERIEVIDGSVKLETGKTRSFSGIDAILTRDGLTGLSAKADIAGRLGRWRADVSRKIDPQTGERQIIFATSGITAAEFLPEEAPITPGRGLGVPIYPRFEALLDREGSFLGARLHTRVAGGWINTGKTAIAFDEIDMHLAWHPDKDGFKIEPSRYVRGRTVIPFEGLVEAPREWQSSWSYRIISNGSRLSPSDVPGPPMNVHSIVVEGDIDPKTRTIGINRFDLRAGTAKVDMVGTVEIREDGSYVALAIETGSMPIASVKRLWPITLAPAARAWVIGHLTEGRINGGSANISLRPSTFDPRDDTPGWAGHDVQMTMSVSDMSVKTIGTLPPVENISGDILIDNATLTVHAAEGAITPLVGDKVTVTGGTFTIGELNFHSIKTGHLSLSAEGKAESLGSVLDSKPFSVLSMRELSASDLSGTGKLDVKASFPLARNTTMSEVSWQLEGELKGFSLAKPVKGREISDATLSFVADPSKIEVQGKGRLNGILANIDIVEPFGDTPISGNAVVAKQGIVLQLTDKDFERLGLDAGSLFSGPMTVTLSQDGDTQRYDIDLTKTKVALDALGWEKSSGVAADAHFELVKTDDGQVLRNFTLTSEGVDIKGEVHLTTSGALQEARFGSFKLRPSDSASLTITRQGRHGLTAELKAEQLDGRGLISSFKQSAGGTGEGSKETLRVKADVDLLIGFNGVSANNIRLEAVKNEAGLQSLTLEGVTGGKNPVTAALKAAGNGRSFDASFANTGETLRLLNLYKRMRGGRGRLTIGMPDKKDWNGNFTVSDLSVTEDPAIQQLASISQYSQDDGALVRNAGAVLRGEASFQKLRIDFRRKGDEITVTEGTLNGATIGGTFTGGINLAAQSLDLTGTFVPIFVLNNLFAKIPVLGFALGGGSDEGLIGVTYRVTGTLSEPDLSVNPVSAIAPGIFRKLFEYN